MSRKITIELEDSEYNELVDLYKEFQKNNPQLVSEVKFEGFVGSIVRTNLEAKRQMDKMGDSFKSMMEMLNSSDMESVLKSFAQNMQNKEQENKKPEDTEKKDEPKEEKSEGETYKS